MSAPIRLATRRSPLAVSQSRWVGDRLSALTGRAVELVEVVTRGDRDPAPLSSIGGPGLFVAAVRRAVIDGAADVAVHSLKDLPTIPDEWLALAAVPEREDPRDALVARAGSGLAALPPGARVGTGSPRRRSQLAAARPDLEVVDIRGNVDSRLARVAVGADLGGPRLDAVVLAAAGLIRLSRQDAISERLDPDVMLPAPGQGALAVEARADLADAQGDADAALVRALRTLDHGPTRAAVTAERSLLSALEAGCSAPVGALAEVAAGEQGTTVHLRAVAARADGTLLRGEFTGPAGEAAGVGRALAEDLLSELALSPERGIR